MSAVEAAVKEVMLKARRALVPSRLLRVYPVDFTLFIASIALVVRTVGAPTVAQAIIAGAGIAGAILLFIGWVANSLWHTKNGAAVLAATWSGQLAYLIVFYGQQGAANDFREVANLLFAVGVLNLAIGLWALLLPVEKEEAQREGGDWWLTRRRRRSA